MELINNRKICQNCKYFGEPTGKDNFYVCHNYKSSYKVALATATGCVEYKERDCK